MNTNPKENGKRPSGMLGVLYDEAAAHTNQPVSRLESMANMALSDGSISEREYEIIRYRVPFEGYDKQTADELRERIENLGSGTGKLSRNRIHLLENKIYSILIDYVTEDPDNEDVNEMGLQRLHWRKSHDSEGVSAYKVFMRHLKRQNKSLTVGSVVEMFDKSAENDGVLPPIPYFGKKALAMTYNLFEEINVKLPQVITFYGNT